MCLFIQTRSCRSSWSSQRRNLDRERWRISAICCGVLLCRLCICPQRRSVARWPVQRPVTADRGGAELLRCTPVPYGLCYRRLPQIGSPESQRGSADGTERRAAPGSRTPHPQLHFRDITRRAVCDCATTAVQGAVNCRIKITKKDPSPRRGGGGGRKPKQQTQAAGALTGSITLGAVSARRTPAAGFSFCRDQQASSTACGGPSVQGDESTAMAPESVIAPTSTSFTGFLLLRRETAPPVGPLQAAVCYPLAGSSCLPHFSREHNIGRGGGGMHRRHFSHSGSGSALSTRHRSALSPVSFPGSRSFARAPESSHWTHSDRVSASRAKH